MQVKVVTTKSGATYTVTEDGVVSRKRGRTPIYNVLEARGEVEDGIVIGTLAMEYGDIVEGGSLLWFLTVNKYAELIRSSRVIAIEEVS